MAVNQIISLDFLNFICPVARPFVANNMSGFGAKLRRLLGFTEKRFTAFCSNLARVAAEAQILKTASKVLALLAFSYYNTFSRLGQTGVEPLTLVRSYNKKEPLSKFLNGKKGS